MATLTGNDIVLVGVDTHRDFHVAVVIDTTGRRLAETTIQAGRDGYAQLVDWASGFGTIDQVGVEGTGTGAAAAVAPAAAGVGA